MGRASGGWNTPHWIRNNILDFLLSCKSKKLSCIFCNFLVYATFKCGDVIGVVRFSTKTCTVGFWGFEIAYPSKKRRG